MSPRQLNTIASLGNEIFFLTQREKWQIDAVIQMLQIVSYRHARNFCLFICFRTANTRETSYAYKYRVSLHAANNVSQSKIKISFCDTCAFVLPLFIYRLLIMHIKICERYTFVIVTSVLSNVKFN